LYFKYFRDRIIKFIKSHRKKKSVIPVKFAVTKYLMTVLDLVDNTDVNLINYKDKNDYIMHLWNFLYGLYLPEFNYQYLEYEYNRFFNDEFIEDYGMKSNIEVINSITNAYENILKHRKQLTDIDNEHKNIHLISMHGACTGQIKIVPDGKIIVFVTPLDYTITAFYDFLTNIARSAFFELDIMLNNYITEKRAKNNSQPIDKIVGEFINDIYNGIGEFYKFNSIFSTYKIYYPNQPYPDVELSSSDERPVLKYVPFNSSICKKYASGINTNIIDHIYKSQYIFNDPRRYDNIDVEKSNRLAYYNISKNADYTGEFPSLSSFIDPDNHPYIECKNINNEYNISVDRTGVFFILCCRPMFVLNPMLSTQINLAETMADTLNTLIISQQNNISSEMENALKNTKIGINDIRSVGMTSIKIKQKNETEDMYSLFSALYSTYKPEYLKIGNILNNITNSDVLRGPNSICYVNLGIILLITLYIPIYLSINMFSESYYKFEKQDPFTHDEYIAEIGKCKENDINIVPPGNNLYMPGFIIPFVYIINKFMENPNNNDLFKNLPYVNIKHLSDPDVLIREINKFMEWRLCIFNTISKYMRFLKNYNNKKYNFMYYVLFNISIKILDIYQFTAYIGGCMPDTNILNTDLFLDISGDSSENSVFDDTDDNIVNKMRKAIYLMCKSSYDNIQLINLKHTDLETALNTGKYDKPTRNMTIEKGINMTNKTSLPKHYKLSEYNMPITNRTGRIGKKKETSRSVIHKILPFIEYPRVTKNTINKSYSINKMTSKCTSIYDRLINEDDEKEKEKLKLLYNNCMQKLTGLRSFMTKKLSKKPYNYLS
jgi:hypothetical protein